MCEFTAVAAQTVNPGEFVIFTATSQACPRGFVRHNDETSDFLLSGAVPNQNGRCCKKRNAQYLVEFGANVAIPTGGTVGEIALAITLNGSTVPATAMRTTPAAVEEFSNVSRAKSVEVWNGCCQDLAIRNIGTEPITVREANIVISRPDLYVSM